MTELPPQNQWHGQAPPPYQAGMPFASPRPSWWRRQPAAIKVLLVSGVAVLTCCGGLLGIGIAAGPAAEPSKAPEKAVAQEVPTVTVPTTAAPTPEVSTVSPEPSPSPTTAAPTTAKPASKPSPRKTTAPAVYYKNCDAVRAAGKAPLRRGEPGYRTGLDRDLDGEACEPGGGNGDSGGGSTGGGGSSGGGGNDPRFGTCKEANANGYGPYRQGKDPEYYWYIDRDNDGTVCE
ncbi:excalibur calcium-binding domain-containing protein [Micromonospora tulbaghiae]|uniref:excalibur calcium-binding domain-containing protein n=1 Tax=Micromonospora tulbaghiae TaxID=479978 RepID=UPI0029C2A2B1|nr:excalibur calcium-binding domain-containing protein [Micromonospora tulbaghiae]MDX5456987.1 excalibur calcium-binding domain-containing protein [Micromonospora tulbaghiae]